MTEMLAHSSRSARAEGTTGTGQTCPFTDRAGTVRELRRTDDRPS